MSLTVGDKLGPYEILPSLAKLMNLPEAFMTCPGRSATISGPQWFSEIEGDGK